MSQKGGRRNVAPHPLFTPMLSFAMFQSVMELAQTLRRPSSSRRGSLAAADKEEVEAEQEARQEVEALYTAIHRLKFSELLPHDQNLFTKISQDIFPGGVVAAVEMADHLDAAIAAVCSKKFLDCHPYLREKVQQLYQMIRWVTQIKYIQIVNRKIKFYIWGLVLLNR